MPRPARLLTVALAAIAGTGALAGCGGGEEHVALAIADTSWNTRGELVVSTECADITEAEFVPSADGGPATMTIWGDPKLGTCSPTIVVPVAPETTKVVDAASSEVVDLPPRPTP